MPRFSANLGFLWTELSLPDAIRAAKANGFGAVELHWPYATPAEEVRAALDETGLPLLGLNTTRGDVAGGENGLTALAGREDEAWAAIEEALAYASVTGAGAVHVMAGFAQGAEAHATFVAALKRAAPLAAEQGVTLLIEPLNRHDAPGYFLSTTDQAALIIEEVGAPNLKLMFDCYHVGRTEGDILTRAGSMRDIIGHVQFAAVPSRGAPDHGELNYAEIFQGLAGIGFEGPLGAEYKPGGPTEPSLAWMAELG
ncbi:MAG: TIM barrel protein [Pseudomonadota bacterium]